MIDSKEDPQKNMYGCRARKTPEEIKRMLVTCLELNMPPDVQHMTMKDALAYIQQLEAQVPRWIGVEERLPEDMVDILLYGEGRYGMGVLSNGWWCCEDMDETHITHWMPLPEPPEEDAHAAD